MGESEWQFNDAVNIAQIQQQNLDIAYLHRRADDLQIRDLLNRLLQELQTIS